jgi:hypothetical protein
LSIWSGAQVTCNRVGKEPIIIDRPFVPVTGGIQPACLPDLIEDGREDGFAARILFSYPDPPRNKDWTEDTVEGADEYAKLCESLWLLKQTNDPLKLSGAAKAVWVEWVNGHRKEETPDHLRPAWSKMEGYCARLALILFLSRQACEQTAGADVDEPSVRGAVRLITYFKSHARRAYSCTADREDNGRIAHALRWVRRREAHGDKVTARLAHMYGLCKDADEAKRLFLDLEELGYGRVTEEARGSVVFRLHRPTVPNTQQDNGREGADDEPAQ